MRKTKFSLREKVVFSLRNTFCSSLEHTLFPAGVQPFPRRAKKRYESLNIWGKEGGASKVVLKT